MTGEFRYMQIEEVDRQGISEISNRKSAIKDILLTLIEAEQVLIEKEQKWWMGIAVKYDIPLPSTRRVLLVNPATGLIYLRGRVSDDELEALEEDIKKQRRGSVAQSVGASVSNTESV